MKGNGRNRKGTAARSKERRKRSIIYAFGLPGTDIAQELHTNERSRVFD